MIPRKSTPLPTASCSYFVDLFPAAYKLFFPDLATPLCGDFLWGGSPQEKKRGRRMNRPTASQPPPRLSQNQQNMFGNLMRSGATRCRVRQEHGLSIGPKRAWSVQCVVHVMNVLNVCLSMLWTFINVSLSMLWTFIMFVCLCYERS